MLRPLEVSKGGGGAIDEETFGFQSLGLGIRGLSFRVEGFGICAYDVSRDVCYLGSEVGFACTEL